MSILILGDGNFSFSASLNDNAEETVLGLTDRQLTCTSFDSHEQLIQKYPESLQILKSLKNSKVLHCINAWELKSHFETRFDLILWNHPHLGTEDFRLHRFLLTHFFHSTTQVLSSGGRVMVSLLQGQETRWDIIGCARKCGLGLASVNPFIETDWPGYVVKRNKHGGSFKNMHTQRHVGTEMKSTSFFFSKESFEAPIDFSMESLTETPIKINAQFSTSRKVQKAPKAAIPGDFSCPHCPRVLTCPRSYSQHVHMVHVLQLFGDWTPNRPKLLQCEHCPKTFASQQDLWQHVINKHTSVDSTALGLPESELLECDYDYVPCNICGQAVQRREYGMYLHLESLKPAIGQNSSCPLCPATFIENRALIQHYKFCRLKSPVDQQARQSCDPLK